MNTEAQAKSAFDDIVVIGDSLSDNGNAGRFSNGSVWVEYLAERLGLSLTPSRAGGGNFAIGGALLDARSGGTSLRAQATAYLQAPQRRGRVLYIVYGGGNDLLAAVGNPRPQAVVEQRSPPCEASCSIWRIREQPTSSCPICRASGSPRRCGPMAGRQSKRRTGLHSTSTAPLIKLSPACLALADCDYTASTCGRWRSGFAPIRLPQALSISPAPVISIGAAMGTCSGTASIRQRKPTGVWVKPRPTFWSRRKRSGEEQPYQITRHSEQPSPDPTYRFS